MLNTKILSIKLFKGVELVEGKSLSTEMTNALVNKALLVGVEIDEKVFNGLDAFEARTLTDMIISMYGVDLAKMNSTFYKTFKESKETPDLIRVIHQALHYASTYGNFDELVNSGEIFEPSVINDENWDSMVKFAKSVITISAIPLDELVEKVNSLVTSGMALSEEDVQFLFEFISKHFEVFNKDKEFIDKIANRELLARIALKFNLVPSNFDELMRVIFLVVIDSTLVVNNKKSKKLFTLASAENKAKGARLFEQYVKRFGEVEASKHVTRYRDFIMLLKSDRNKTLINRVLKLSKKNYQGRKEDPLSTIANDSTSFYEVKSILTNSFTSGTLSIYRLIRLINATRKTIAAGTSPFSDLIKIRNGKTHVRDERQLTSSQLSLLKSKERLLLTFIPKLIGDSVKDKVFVFNDIFVPVAPTSGKTFVGFIPEYSYFKVGKDRGVVGVAWNIRGDLDLHGTSVTSNLGWNTIWNDSNVVYTGDMTGLNRLGFAAEFFESHLDEGEVLSVNVSPFNFAGEYQLVVASGLSGSSRLDQSKAITESVKDIVYVDTRSIGLDGERGSEQLFTLIKLDGIYRAVFLSGGSIGGNVIDHTLVRSTLDSNSRAMKTMLTMEELLRLAGATIISDGDEYEAAEDVELISLDAKDITKDTFTSIFK